MEVQIRNFFKKFSPLLKGLNKIESKIKKYHYISALMLFALITVAYFLPLVKTITTDLPAGDPSLNAWIMDWNYKTILSGHFKGYYDAPIFYPYKQAFLFSETLIFLSIISYPIFLTTKNLAFTYNVLFLCAYIFSALSAYALAYYYTKNRVTSFIAGLIFAFAPSRIGNIGHLQIISAYFLPLIILYTEKYLKHNLLKISIILGILLSLIGLISLYQFTFAILIIGVICVYRVIQWHQDINVLKLLRNLIPAAAIFLLVLGPIYFNYYKFSKDYLVVRNMVANNFSSGDLIGSLITTPEPHPIYGKMCNVFRLYARHTNYQCHELSIFLGVIPTILILIAIFTIIKTPSGYTIGIRREKVTLYITFLALTMFILYLGPYLKVWGKDLRIKMPYYLFYYLVPLAQGLRVPGRLKVLYTLLMGIIAGIGAVRLSEVFKSSVYKHSLLLAVCMFCLVDLYPGKPPLEKIYNYKNPAYTYIKTHKNIKTIIEVPAQGELADIQANWTDPLLGQTMHGKAVANGYSGYFPEGYIDFLNFFKTEFPSQESLDLLREMKIDAMIVNKTKMEPMKLLKTRELKGIEILYKDDVYEIYSIVPSKRKEKIQDPIIESVTSERVERDVEVIFSLRNDTEAVWVSEKVEPVNKYFEITFENGATCDMGFKMPLFIKPRDLYTIKYTCKFGMMTRILKPDLQPGENVRVLEKDTQISYKTLLQ